MSVKGTWVLLLAALALPACAYEAGDAPDDATEHVASSSHADSAAIPAPVVSPDKKQDPTAGGGDVMVRPQPDPWGERAPESKSDPTGDPGGDVSVRPQPDPWDPWANVAVHQQKTTK